MKVIREEEEEARHVEYNTPSESKPQLTIPSDIRHVGFLLVVCAPKIAAGIDPNEMPEPIFTYPKPVDPCFIGKGKGRGKGDSSQPY